tara:strand:- start:22 stop:1323 length:1302 start_codon:yes stop_codon:yes gene_type:complete
MAISAAVLKVGSMLARSGGAIAKGGKAAMKKGGTILKKTKKVNQNVKKAVFKKKKIDKETLISKDRAQKKKLEKDKRKQEEELLEKRNNKEKKPTPQKTMKKGGGILQKIIDFISTILIGWVVTNLPKIIDSVKGVIKKIKDIYNNITGFFSSFGEFFGGIKNIVSSTLDKIKNIDFSNIGEKIKEKITGLKDAFTNLIANVGKGLGILKSKKKQDPEKLAKSGFGGDASAENNNSSKKVDDKNSEVDVLKKDTNKLMSDTTGLEGNLNESLKKAESEMSKVDLNVIKKDIKSVTKDGNITTETVDGKTLKSGGEGYSDQLKRAQGAVTKTMKNVTEGGKFKNITSDVKNKLDTTLKKVTKDGSKFISKANYSSDVTGTITPQKKSKNIVIDNIIPSQQTMSAQGETQTELIIVGKSSGSMVKENILLDAAYT